MLDKGKGFFPTYGLVALVSGAYSWANWLLSLKRAPGSRMQLAMLHFHFMRVGTFHVIDMSGTKIPFYKVSL